MRICTPMILVVLLTCGCNLFQSVESTETTNGEPDTSIVDMGGMDVSTEDMSMLADAGPDLPTADMQPDIEAPDFGPADLAWNRGAARVEENLLLFYTFAEGEGVQAADLSARGDQPALLLDPTITWLEDRNGISIPAEARARNSQVGAEIFDHVTLSEEMTVEIWMRPGNLTQGGPARIATYSQDGGIRNFTLGQVQQQIDFRFRMLEIGISSNGIPSVTSPDVLTGSEAHVVVTYDGITVRIYFDGVEVASGERYGGLSNWTRNHTFVLGNENADERPWEGEIYLLAIYDRALTPDEVTQNLNAGPEP